jgi:hypothetical protein
VFTQTLRANNNGFRPHAAVPCAADDRQTLRPLCRYVTRPALANERVQTNAACEVLLQRETAWRNGTTHLATEPMYFIGQQVGWRLCGSTIGGCHVGNGSIEVNGREAAAMPTKEKKAAAATFAKAGDNVEAVKGAAEDAANDSPSRWNLSARRSNQRGQRSGTRSAAAAAAASAATVARG